MAKGNQLTPVSFKGLIETKKLQVTMALKLRR